MKRHDTIVVGAGILGLAVAREVLARRPGERVLVVERESTPAAHQSSHNSGVVHGGVYYAAGSLKARLCVEGAARMVAYCEANAIEVRPIGKLIVALAPGELASLDELERRGRANGVPELRRLDADGLRAIEPHAAGIAALHSPTTAIVDFAAVCRQLACDVTTAGGELRLGWPVCAVTSTAGEIRLRSSPGDEAHATRAVFCAGLWSDRLAVLAGADPDPRIVPFRGAYRRLRPERRTLVRGLIYPVPAIEPDDLVYAFAGVRAQAVGRDGRLIDDFLIARTPRAIHVRNAPSPAATSALALASLITDAADQLA